MATKYVSKGGNDSNDGSSWALSKLTIQGAVTAATSGDTIEIGSGEYNEAVSWTGTTKSLTYNGNGYVLLRNNAAYAIAISHSVAGNAATVVVVNVHIKDYTNTGVSTGGSTSNPAIAARNCKFENLPNGLNAGSGGTTGVVTLKNCLFVGCNNGINPAPATSVTINAVNNTFVGGSTGILASNPTTVYITALENNIFVNQIRCIDFGSRTPTMPTTFDYNIHYGWGTAICRRGNTDYTTHAAWKAAASPAEQNCQEVDPQFLDSAKGVYGFTTASPASTAGRYGTFAGWTPPVWSRSTNNNPDSSWSVSSGTTLASDAGTQWVPSVTDGVVDDGTGNLALNTSGAVTLTSRVYDANQAQNVFRFDLGVDETNPTNVIDADIDDTLPNRRNIEYRSSASTFNQNDGVIAWSEVEMNTDLASPVALARYRQFRLTFRDNGVAA